MDETRLDLLREEIQEGFRGTHLRLDKLNDRTRSVEQKVAVLEAGEQAGRSDKVARWGVLGALLAGAASWWNQ